MDREIRFSPYGTVYGVEDRYSGFTKFGEISCEEFFSKCIEATIEKDYNGKYYFEINYNGMVLNLRLSKDAMDAYLNGIYIDDNISKLNSIVNDGAKITEDNYEIYKQRIIEKGDNNEKLSEKEQREYLRYMLQEVKPFNPLKNIIKDDVLRSTFLIFTGIAFGIGGMCSLMSLCLKTNISLSSAILSFSLPFFLVELANFISSSIMCYKDYRKRRKIYKTKIKKLQSQLGIDIEKEYIKKQKMDESKNAKVISDGILKEIYNLLNLISSLSYKDKMMFAKQLKAVKDDYMSLLEKSAVPNFEYTDEYFNSKKKIVDSLAKIELQVYPSIKRNNSFSKIKKEANSLDEVFNEILEQDNDYVVMNKEDLAPKKEHVYVLEKNERN